MLKNYLKIAWRNALRQKQFTFLNIIGLTIGISTCFVVGLYVHSELTYDVFHEKTDRIYRINQSNIWGDFNDISPNTGPNVATALKKDVPEFEEVSRLLSIGPQTINYTNSNKGVKSFKENAFIAAEENFLDLFSFKTLNGNSNTALKEPMTVVMTLETAKRYFGEDDAIGKSIEVKDNNGTWNTFTVSAVLENIPTKSHLQFDALFSMNSYQEQFDQHGWKWIWTAFSTYVLVNEGTDISTLAQKIQSLPEKWAPPTTERIFNQSFKEFTKGNEWKLVAQPLQEIYRSGDPEVHSFGPTGNKMFVRLFSAIGILVLILSSINFMNLSTARSSKRAKEIGVRKVLGSKQKALIKQFVVESTLFVFISTLLAIVVVQVSLDAFNTIAEKNLEFGPYLSNSLFIIGILFFILFLGVVAGSYPAFYLSSFMPAQTLRGKIGTKFKGKGIRNGLIVFQFSISIALIICALFVQKQLSYTSVVDIGFAKENILQIHNIDQLGFDTEMLKNKLKSNSAFTKVGKSFGVPPNIWTGDRYKAGKASTEVVQLSNIRSEAEYLDVLGLDFIVGRNFDPTRANDKYGVILNETAVKLLGWGTKDTYKTDAPTDKFLAMASGSEDEFKVLGVVKDFNYNSVKEIIQPLVIIHHKNDKVWDYGTGYSFYSMRLNQKLVQNKDELELVINDVKNEIAQIDPSIPFEYSFMDKGFENVFRAELKMGTVLNFFTLMALIIACLGLFGLAVFAGEQRIKELGIRKVLGAKVWELVILFSSEFIKLIGVSLIIASPIAYFLVDHWLGEFAYRTPITIWVFLAVALCTLLITLLTVSLQAIKAATTNPVKILRDE